MAKFTLPPQYVKGVYDGPYKGNSLQLVWQRQNDDTYLENLKLVSREGSNYKPSKSTQTQPATKHNIRRYYR
jgi:hypothetical protein